jgi:DNA-directed RNA polymerase specialized sigma24 family protein
MQEAINVWTRWNDGLTAVQLTPVVGDTGQKKGYLYSAGGSQPKSLRELLGREAEVGVAAYFRLDLLEVQSVTDLWPNLRLPEAPTVITGPKGIDFNLKYKDIERLLRAGFMRKILAAGFDFQDVLQEVYMGMLVRNQGKCPWDPSKGSFSHYVWLCIDSILTNYHRKNRVKHTGVGYLEEMEIDPEDHTPQADSLWSDRKRTLKRLLAEDPSQEARWAEELFELQLKGFKRADLVDQGWSQSKQIKATKKLRSLARPE